MAENYLIERLKNTEISLCVGRIFSFTDKNQKTPFVIPSIIKKINDNRSEKIEILNLNHYRDFLSTTVITKFIYYLFKKKKVGIFNIASGYSFHLEKIATLLCKKNKKIFVKTKKLSLPTYLVADIKKISNICFFVKRKFRNNLNYFY